MKVHVHPVHPPFLRAWIPEIYLGGLWKAAIHRVKFHPGKRLSIVSGALKPRNDVVIQTLRPKDVLKNQIIYPPIMVEDFVKERVKLHYPQYLEEKNEGQKDHEFIQTLKNNIKDYKIWTKFRSWYPEAPYDKANQ